MRRPSDLAPVNFWIPLMQFIWVRCKNKISPGEGPRSLLMSMCGEKMDIVTEKYSLDIFLSKKYGVAESGFVAL